MQPTERCTFFLDHGEAEIYFMYRVPQDSSSSESEDDDPRDVKNLETEGKRDIEGLGIELPFVGHPIKLKKVNIGTEQAPKMENVGDYWDDATISKIT